MAHAAAHTLLSRSRTKRLFSQAEDADGLVARVCTVREYTLPHACLHSVRVLQTIQAMMLTRITVKHIKL